MRTWLRRLSYLLFVFVWLAVMIFPIVAFSLVNNDTLQWGDERQHIRLFMAHGDDVEGVGLEWTRPIPGTMCTQSSLNYLTWVGEGENARYCQCYDGEEVVSAGPNACP